MNGPLHQVPWIGGSGRAARALGAAGVMAVLASAATAKDLAAYLLEVRSGQQTPLFTGDSTDYMPAQSVERCHMS